MTFDSILDARTVNALGWALLHFLWQGTLAALVLATAQTIVPRHAARTRYALAAATLAVMAALPVYTFLSGVARAADTAMPAAVAAAAVVRESAAVGAVAGNPGAGGLRDRLAAALPLMVGSWALGVALLSIRVIGGWTLAQRLARSGRPATADGLGRALARLCEVMRVSRPVRLLESMRVEIPTVIGWMRPVILFPAATMAGLTPAQLEFVLAHELAHVRRLDYLVNFLQTAIETLLFYHPAVWWVSQRVRVEREHCCDDAAVAACGDAIGYARALADLEGLRVSAAGLALAADGGSLVQRVSRLIGGKPAHAPRASRALGALLALAVLPAVLAGMGWIDAHAQSGSAGAGLATVPDAEGTPAAAEAEEAQSAAEAQPAPRAAESKQKATRDAELPIAEVIELAKAGVTPEYLDEMTAAGYPSLSWRELIELRGQGVTPEYVRGLAAEGYSGLTTQRLVELRSQGVGPDFVKELREAGLEKLSLAELLELRSQGVSSEFVNEMKAEGYADLSPTALVNLRNQGVTPEYVRELKKLGYGDLSTTRLVALRNQGVTPEYIQELKVLGYADLSVPVLIGLRNQGVTPEYVRDLKKLGYDGLAAGLLVELRNQGVTPEFVREIKDAGYGNVTPEDLIELRSQGVSGDLLRRLRRK